MFSFEAGRRCDSGPGNFTFETKQGNEIFALVDQAIQSQKALVEDRNLSPSGCDPDCPASLLHLHSPALNAASASGDERGGGREADCDSGGSKPGSADGVLGKREGGDGGMGRGQGGGVKGRSLPELPAMLGVGSRGQGAAKAADGPVGLYSEPADSVRLPAFDSLYSDPVDSLQSQPGKAPVPPTPTPRLRTAGDEPLGDHHHTAGNHRKPPDLFAHMYDHISMELKQKTAALSLNGGGKRGGKEGNRKARPSGGQAEGASSSSASSSEHIYDEPEGCAQAGAGAPPPGMTIYDEAWVEPKRQDEAAPPSAADTSYSTLSLGNMSDCNRQCPPQPGPSRPARWAKPATAPKPAKGGFGRKDPMPLPYGKHGGNANNNNNVWGGGGRRELYGSVSKQTAPSPPPWSEQQKQAPMRSPDIIYDNLGNI